MLGIFHVTLTELLALHGGPGAVARLLEQAGLPAGTRFRIDTCYPDTDAERLLATAAQVLGLDAAALHRAYAAHAGAWALWVFPSFFELAPDSREFLRSQPRFAGLLDAGAQCAGPDPLPTGAPGPIEIETPAPDALRIRWRASPGLLALYRELLRWVVRHYRDVADVRMQVNGSGTGMVAIYDLSWIRFAGDTRRHERFETTAPDESPVPPAA